MRPLKITLTLLLAGLTLWLIAPLRSSATPDQSLSPDQLIRLHPALAKQLLSAPQAEVRVQIILRDQSALTAPNRAALIVALQARAEQAQALDKRMRWLFPLGVLVCLVAGSAWGWNAEIDPSKDVPYELSPAVAPAGEK